MVLSVVTSKERKCMGGDDDDDKDDGGDASCDDESHDASSMQPTSWDRGFDHSFIATRDCCNIDRPCMGQVGMWFAMLCFVIRI